MVAYIKHAGSCNAGAGHVLYNNDASAVEWFKFYEHSVDFLGDRAIYINDDETYIGHGAGDNIGAGIGNTLMGHNAGQANSFSNAVLIGQEAGKNNTQNSTVAIGYRALQNNTGAYNTAFGYKALNNNTTGTYNLAIGYAAMQNGTTGIANLAIGYQALFVNTGTNNLAVGNTALRSTTDGNNNTGLGQAALENNTVGNNNTAFGHNAGAIAAVDIDACVYFGYGAGKNNATSNRLYINNSDSAFPLIYGEFDNDKVKFGDNNAYWFAQILHENAGGQLFLKECTTPTAQPNYGAIYCKADNKLYFQDGAGVEHEVTIS